MMHQCPGCGSFMTTIEETIVVPFGLLPSRYAVCDDCGIEVSADKLSMVDIAEQKGVGNGQEA